MALLSMEDRVRILKADGLEYNEKGIKAFQKKYMLRKKDYDGIWGPNTDNCARTVDNVRKYTKNFAVSEFRCECGGRYCCGFPDYMKPAILQAIQSVRDHYGRPVIITCGVRDTTVNRKVGGITHSKHLCGKAVDFYVKGVTDTLSHRRTSIKWIKGLPLISYVYGDGIDSNGSKRRYPGMGNCMHMDVK